MKLFCVNIFRVLGNDGVQMKHVYGIQELSDDNLALAHSPLVIGIAKTLEYATQKGQIELTKSGGFKRSFVNWAAAEFKWPDYTEQDLFRVNKVLNEWDFQPLAQIHALMLHLKIGRHFKGAFRLTKKGQSLVGRPGIIFSEVATVYLFNVVHSYRAETALGAEINWVILLNILNVEAENGVSRKRMGELVFPATKAPGAFDMRPSDAYIAVLRPLCWLGFLREHKPTDIRKWQDAIFTKTPLWQAALRLQTDEMQKPITLH